MRPSRICHTYCKPAGQITWRGVQGFMLLWRRSNGTSMQKGSVLAGTHFQAPPWSPCRGRYSETAKPRRRHQRRTSNTRPVSHSVLCRRAIVRHKGLRARDAFCNAGPEVTRHGMFKSAGLSINGIVGEPECHDKKLNKQPIALDEIRGNRLTAYRQSDWSMGSVLHEPALSETFHHVDD